MADLTEKLKEFFGRVPKAKEQADNVEATLEQLGVKSKEAGRYLVSGEGGDHLPVRDEDGKVNHTLMGAAWAALHGGYRGNQYEGPHKAEALSKLIALYKSEGMETPSDSGAEKKEMEEPTAEVKEKLVLKDEEEKKDNPEEEKIEEGKAVNADKKEADVPDIQALMNQIQTSLEASTKEAKDLRAELATYTAAQVKEMNDLKVATEEGFVKAKEIIDAQSGQIKDLAQQLVQADARIKELLGEVPTSVRQPYHPSRSFANILSQTANAPVMATIKEAREAIQQQNTQNPIFGFLDKANQSIGIKTDVNGLPQ